MITRKTVVVAASAGAVGAMGGYGLARYGHLSSLDAIWTGLIGIDAGDWLQACAGFFGIIFTIVATRELERSRERRIKREEFGSLFSFIEQMLMVVRAIEKLPNTDTQTGIDMHRLWIAGIQANRDLFGAAKSQIKSHSLPLYAAMRMCEMCFDQANDLHGRYAFIDEDSAPQYKVEVWNSAHAFGAFFETQLVEMAKIISEIIGDAEPGQISK